MAKVSTSSRAQTRTAAKATPPKAAAAKHPRNPPQHVLGHGNRAPDAPATSGTPVSHSARPDGSGTSPGNGKGVTRRGNVPGAGGNWAACRD